jgi:prepilin-type processing-associated H-X9-DG protein
MEDAPKRTRRFSVEGIIVILITLVVGAMLVLPALDWRPRPPHKAICRNNLKQLHVGMMVYVQAFGAKKDYPPHTGPRFLQCLAGRCGDRDRHPEDYFGRAPLPIEGKELNCLRSREEGVFASYLGPRKHTPAGNPSALMDGLPARTPVAADRKGNHADGGNVLFLDGSVEFLTGGDYEKALAQLE